MEVIPSISEVADYLKCNASDLEDKTKLAYWFKTEAGELDPIKLKLFGYGLVTYCNRTRGCDEPLLPVNREVVQLLYTSVENDDSYHHFLTRIKKLVEEEVLVLCNEETEAGDIFFADGKHPLIQKYYAKEYLDGYKHNAMHLLCRPSAVYTIGSNIRIKAVAARFRAYHSALQNAVISMHEYISQLEKVSNEEQITEAKMKMELALKENCDLKAKCEALEKGNKVLKGSLLKTRKLRPSPGLKSGPVSSSGMPSQICRWLPSCFMRLVIMLTQAHSTSRLPSAVIWQPMLPMISARVGFQSMPSEP